MYIPVDDEAKCPVALLKAIDQNGFPFFKGKLQFPGTLDLERGVCFMVFVSEDGCEELQISPINSDKRSRRRSTSQGINPTGKIVIDLHKFTDKTGQIGYVGEAQAPVSINMIMGLHFTVFTSREGREAIHIGRLDHSHLLRKRERTASDNDRYDNTEQSEGESDE